jgi:colanic acid/amylovoran biosynthesis glycosyltransferase
MKTPVAHSVNPYLPASGSWIYNQLTNLSRYSPIVLTKRKDNLDSFPFSPVFAQYDLNPFRRGWGKLYKNLTGTYFPTYRKVLEQYEVPLLHSHFCTYGMEDVSLKKALNLKHITTFYGSDIWANAIYASWREKFRIFAHESDLFLVEGGAMRDKVVGLGAPSEKVVVFHLGVELGQIKFKPRSPGPAGRINILMAGRAIEKKGHMYGLMAFERLARKYPQIHLDMIVGDKSIKSGEITERMRRFIRDKGIADRVSWDEFMPYKEYLGRLERAHIFLQPSVMAEDGDAEGGFPVTIIELSAAGVPVVGTAHCDIPEAIIDGVTGFVAPEKDVDALADRLERLIAEPGLWPKFGEAGRAHVEREYNIKTQVGKLEDIYDGLLGVR